MHLKFGWYLVVFGLLLLALRAIAIFGELAAQFFIDVVRHTHGIRFSWIVIIELLGLFMVYGLQLRWMLVSILLKRVLTGRSLSSLFPTLKSR